MTSRAPTILLIGGTGQIGRELARELAGLGTVVAPGRDALDLASPESIRAAIRPLRPTIVVNAAAYTLVDRAELEPDLCAQLNADAPGLLAAECNATGAVFLHFSTDYVFDGTKQTPYVETDASRPLSVYGRTKREGEEAVARAGGAYLIVRTAWIYSAHGGGRNFPATILRLAREREALAVVNDQVGAPTSARAVAAGVAQMLGALSGEGDVRGAAEAAAGVYHMTASGSTTWYEFAQTILANDPRSSEHTCRTIQPISTAEYPTMAVRPAYSVLDNTKLTARFGVRLPSWMEQWRATVAVPRPSDPGASVPRTQ